MNTTERERPIRLTFVGEVESYDWQAAQWIRDLSRDPRELVPLSYPPAASAYLYLQKVTCANAVVHALRQSFLEQKANLADMTPSTPDVIAELEARWQNVYYGALYLLGIKANSFNIYTYEAVFFYGLVYSLSSQFALVDLATLMDSSWWDKVVCHVWCHMSEDCTFTYPNWLSLVQAIYDDSTLGDAQQWLKLMVVLLGRKGLTNLGFLKVNDSDVSDPATDCTC